MSTPTSSDPLALVLALDPDATGPARHLARLADGTEMSVLVRDGYAAPGLDETGPVESVEVGLWQPGPPTWRADQPDRPGDSPDRLRVYGWVSVADLLAFAASRGGTVEIRSRRH